jgi:hypothetical protein
VRVLLCSPCRVGALVTAFAVALLALVLVLVDWPS